MSPGYVSPLLLYNMTANMIRRSGLPAIAMLVLMLASCAANSRATLVDPFPLRFPLVEAGTLDIDGHIVGQPRARDGIVYYATREGDLTAVVVRSQAILWRFKADHPLTAGPELGDDRIVLRDDANIVYVLTSHGSIICKTSLDGPVTTTVGPKEGKLYFGTSGGKVQALDIAGGGSQLWEYRAPSSEAAVTAGPVFGGDRVVFGTAEGRILALGQDGTPVWEFDAEGAITTNPVAHAGRLYFGTEGRRFYCLKASSGKKIWSRRLQGAPVHSALVLDRRLVVAASNSVVYFLSPRGGSIVSWEPVASRVIYEPAAADPLVLISGATPGFKSLNALTGSRVDEHATTGLLVAGAVWSPPFVILFEEDPDSGQQRLTTFRSR